MTVGPHPPARSSAISSQSSRPLVADLGVDLVRRRVVEVGVEHAPPRSPRERAPAHRRHRAAGVAAAALRRRGVDGADPDDAGDLLGDPDHRHRQLVLPHQQTVAAHASVDHRLGLRGAGDARPRSRTPASSRRGAIGPPRPPARSSPRAGRGGSRTSSRMCIASRSARRAVPPVCSAHAAAIARAVGGTLVTPATSGSACSHSSTSSAPDRRSSGLASSGCGGVRSAANRTSSSSPRP